MAAPLQSHAADKSKTKAAHSAKERLVLMPIRVPEEDKNLTGAMETALVKGLQQKYDVFSGERVAQKAHEIFMKESRNTAHTECDETRCMQNIAEAFQAELIATANVTKQDGSYFLAISIQNIFDNKVEYSESMPCKGCDATQVVDMLKTLSGATVNNRIIDEKSEALPSVVRNSPLAEQNITEVAPKQTKIEQEDALLKAGQEAKRAYDDKDFAKAAELYRSLAQQGDDDAQYHLAFMYEVGQGVSQNPKEAGRWYRLAAEQGHDGAQYYLAFMYKVGSGVLQDYKLAKNSLIEN